MDIEESSLQCWVLSPWRIRAASWLKMGLLAAAAGGGEVDSNRGHPKSQVERGKFPDLFAAVTDEEQE